MADRRSKEPRLKAIVAWICEKCGQRVKAAELARDLRCPSCQMVTPWKGVIRKVA